MRPGLKQTIQKVVTRSLWGTAMIGFLILFVASMKVKSNQKCSRLIISITNAKNLAFVKPSDITYLLQAHPNLNPIGKAIHSIQPKAIKSVIKKNPWIAKVIIYIDNNNQLHLDVTQKQPLARIFTLSGSTFYIDQNGKSIPVTNRFSLALPIFTNWPMDGPAGSGPDSVLFSQVLKMSQFLNQDSFWNAQIVQVNITPDGEFELIPRLGNQVIKFGDGENLQNKFDRLFSFYKNGLPTLGWEKYSIINVKYDNEVVCTKKEPTKVTSIPKNPLVSRDSVQFNQINPHSLGILVGKKSGIIPISMSEQLPDEQKNNDHEANPSSTSKSKNNTIIQHPKKQIIHTTKTNNKI